VIPAIDIHERVPLAPKTTFELGGPARFYLRAADERTVIDGLVWARRRGVKVAILGGGSNLVVSDDGFDGLVIEMAQLGIEERAEGDRVIVQAQAGEPWDPFVARAVAAGYAGLECLSGIPGRVGATPIQNVGAYGQEVSETLRSVRVIDRASLEARELAASACELRYRDSFFKQSPDRYVVVRATFALVPEGAPSVRYAELERALPPDRSLADVRDKVIELRRNKSMVIDEDDPNRRSAGSFFMNPIVDDAIVAPLIAKFPDMPRWAAEGKTKLAAGWLIERAGMERGMRHGHVGISSRHALALVHHGDGRTSELLELARRVRAAVEGAFGVRLELEPTLWGTSV
jgi:UDP-N-acetylmuramate dehydrogenase